METKTASAEVDWLAAEAALADARKMPGGAERIEALRRADQLRNDADKRRLLIQENRKLVRG
jgi:hypothetical protein